MEHVTTFSAYILSYRPKFEIPIRDDLVQYCRASNNLYNQALYHVRQTLDRENRWMTYAELCKVMPTLTNLEGTINYRLLPAQTSQQILKVLSRSITSYCRLIKDWSKNKEKYKAKPEFPHYRKRGGMFNIYFTNQGAKIYDGKLQLTRNIRLDIPQYNKYAERLKALQMVRIIPLRKTFRVELVYQSEVMKADVDTGKYASIDPGVGNLCTMFCEDGTFIYDGKFLKSYNHFYNQRIARLKSIKDKQGVKGDTKRLYALHDKRNRYFEDAFHKISRLIVDYLIEHRIGNLVVGKNKGWKQNADMGAIGNQRFVQIPHARLYSMLKYKCEMVGINYIEQQESHTSKCDALAHEEICHHDDYLGRRVKRGLFRSSTGKVINADVNGAINILRKAVGDSVVYDMITNSGVSLTPIRCCNPFKRVV